MKKQRRLRTAGRDLLFSLNELKNEVTVPSYYYTSEKTVKVNHLCKALLYLHFHHCSSHPFFCVVSVVFFSFTLTVDLGGI